MEGAEVQQHGRCGGKSEARARTAQECRLRVVWRGLPITTSSPSCHDHLMSVLVAGTAIGRIVIQRLVVCFASTADE